MIDTSLFPHENHPYRLEFGEKKNVTVCWFSCEDHLQKYLKRYKLDTKTIKIDYRDEQPVKSSKKQQDSVPKRPRKTSDRSSSGTKRGTKKLDSLGGIDSTRKPKSK
jgi:hypothetical protein